MADENEIIAEEIYEYYQKKQNESEHSEEKSAEKELPKPASEIAKRLPAISAKVEYLFSDKKRLYIISAVLAALLIILCGYLIGLIIPKNEEKVTEILETLKEESKDFKNAQSDNERLSDDVDELYEERAERKAELNNITDYEETRDQAKNDLDDLTAQLEALQSEIDQKSAELAELDAAIKEMGGGEIVLSPGMYTVGKHIAAGEYSVTGDGSLLVSDSQSKLKINTKLTSDSFICPLSDGDTIKLETEAEFNPAD